jgi:glycosidase
MKPFHIIKLFLISFLLTFNLGSCNDDNDTIKEISNSEVSPVTAHNKVIYEINARNYSSEGFNGVKKDLQRLKDLGVDIIWLMPIHPIGALKREGSLGSPYSIRDYKAINPELGTENDFKSLIETAHSIHIEIWMDWVANHTAWDHPWVTSHLDYYASQNGQQPYSPNGWNDVAQLNYSNPNLCTAMIDAMKYWVQNYNIDGYRCDAVTFVPLDFWQQAIPQVNSIRKIKWLAEGDNPAYMSVFDYDYAWDFNNKLNDFGTGSNASGLIQACKDLYNNPAYSGKGRMVYLTNHDLNSHDGTEFVRYGTNVLPLSVLSFTIYDMPLLYNGQEIGMNKSISLFNPDPVQWDPANKIYLNLFKKLILLKRTQPALEDGAGRGTLKIYPTNKENVFVYSRKKGDNEVLIMLNFNNVAVNFKWTGEIPSGNFKDYLNDGQKTFSSSEGNILMEKGYALFVK